MKPLPTTAIGPESPLAQAVWADCVRDVNPCPPRMAIDRVMELEHCERPHAIKLLREAAADWLHVQHVVVFRQRLGESWRRMLGTGRVELACCAVGLNDGPGIAEYLTFADPISDNFYRFGELIRRAVAILEEMEAIP
jgi:hypothetical protein